MIEDQFSDDRRNWALISVIGGAMTMTVYAAVCLWLLRAHPGFIFYLGMSAMIQILVIFTGILGLLIKRNINVSRSSISISDHDQLVSKNAAEKAVEDAVDALPTVTNDSTNKSS